MKARNILIAAAFAALTLLGAGCKKNNWRPTPGEEIRFKAVSNPSARAADTKTSYSGKYYSVEVDDRTANFERVDWVVGDVISVGYAARTGAAFTYAGSSDYVISSVDTPTGVKSNAHLTPATGNGLVWQEGDYHGFYATYPACTSLEGFKFEIDADGAIYYLLPCEYPKTQVVTLAEGKTAKRINGDLLSSVVYEPDMSYAWQLANAEPADWTVQGGEINLRFESHVTAFEFTADCGDDFADGASLSISSFEMSDESAALTGTFLFSIDNNGETTDTASDDVSKKVTLYFNEDHTPITLTKGSPINFTVLTSCVDTKEALTITFNVTLPGETEPTTRSLKLQKYSGENLVGEHFGNALKHRIYGLKIPKDLTPDGWFDATDAGGYLNQDW